MDSFLIYFKNSYSVIILLIILSTVFTFLSSKISGKEAEKTDYSLAVSVSILSGLLILYINELKGKNTEVVLTGVAPF
jgi:hypothetical protein